MSDQLALSDAAHARVGDPWTSHAAARSIPPDKLRESQAAVLNCFRACGAMHHELLLNAYHLAGYPPQSPSGLRTRTKELVDAGYIEDTGHTVRLPSGRHSKVWQAT